MLTYGTALDHPNDPLQKVEIETIARKIKDPKPEFVSRIDQLRQIRLIDEKQYRRLKVSLPYFCCSIFNPPYRRTENFASIGYFVLDFDHLTGENMSKDEITQKLKGDHHLRLLFTSPGGDGLKALFQLEEACRDAGKYSHFYKAFTQSFARKYGLEKVTDWVTHDVTRATFFSADRNAWDNPIATPVKIHDYIAETIDPLYSTREKAFQELAREHTHDQATDYTGKADDSTLAFIKSKLTPNYRPKKEKNVFVPEEINKAIPLITEALAEEQISIEEIKSIHFGKQLKVRMKHYWAEINIFHGKNGFSVVRTTKTGSHSELAELAYQIVDAILN